MAKNHRIKILILLHCLVLIGIYSFCSYIHEQHYKSLEYNVLSTMKSVTLTASNMPYPEALLELNKLLGSELILEHNDSRYLAAQEALKKILSANDLADYELSVLVYNEVNDQFLRLASSDDMYSFREVLSNTSDDMKVSYSMGSATLENLSDDIQKYVAFSPIYNTNGEEIGAYRLSSGRIVSKTLPLLATWWLWSILLIYAALAYLLTPGLGRNPSRSMKEKRTEILDQQLRKKEQELKMLSLVAKKSENLMLITDAKGIILWVNETYENKNNYSAEELSTFNGKYLPDVSRNVHIRTILRNVVDFKKSVVYESSSTMEDGATHYAMTTVTPIKDENDRVHKLLFVDTDITKLKTIEKENSAFKRFVELSGSPRIIMNRSGKVIFNNDTAQPLLQKWKGNESKINDTILSLIQSICDAKIAHTIEYEVQEKSYRVGFYPLADSDEIHILAEELTNQLETIR